LANRLNLQFLLNFNAKPVHAITKVTAAISFCLPTLRYFDEI